MDMVVNRFDVFYVNIDPTLGSEIKKTRPCVNFSTDEMNRALKTIIVAPLTSTMRKYPTRIDCVVQRKKGQIALDQIRIIDKERLLDNRIAVIGTREKSKGLTKLKEFFS